MEGRMTQEIKLCKDCKFYVKKPPVHECTRMNKEINLVTGESYGYSLDANKEREFDRLSTQSVYNHCGKEGKYWEEKI
jgi:hypothetical protein